ncbi:unnamed protein product [Rotaria socialis]|uniref:PPIase cyclophilin-type domain-containing protein n=2 Tax=Rotaria socialis TaxID=392032 RepID=A0A820UVU8_9BILA|nr:unnamed protein product [Rotaria socialis]
MTRVKLGASQLMKQEQRSETLQLAAYKMKKTSHSGELSSQYYASLVELYLNFLMICPRTCENIRCLYTGEKGRVSTSNKKLYYKKCHFHRIVNDIMIQSGDFTECNGTGSELIYGGIFDGKDSNYFQIKHDQAYLLSVDNQGFNTNGAQFFTTSEASHLDGRSLQDVVIAHCGQLIRNKKAKDDNNSQDLHSHRHGRERNHHDQTQSTSQLKHKSRSTTTIKSNTESSSFRLTTSSISRSSPRKKRNRAKPRPCLIRKITEECIELLIIANLHSNDPSDPKVLECLKLDCLLKRLISISSQTDFTNTRQILVKGTPNSSHLIDKSYLVLVPIRKPISGRN